MYLFGNYLFYFCAPSSGVQKYIFFSCLQPPYFNLRIKLNFDVPKQNIKILYSMKKNIIFAVEKIKHLF
jgi:hypothetical protein